jgi:hypothetical protein
VRTNPADNPLPSVSPLTRDEVSGHKSYQSVSSYAGDVILVRIHGSVNADADNETITSKLSERVASSVRDVHVFFDLEGFTRYESRVRVRYTDALTTHGSKINAIYVFADSRLVRMGASVAGMVLRQLSLVDRNAFDRLLRDRIGR